MKAGFHSRWFLTVLVCAVMSPMALGATTWHMGGGGKADPNTIQAAVDAAADGDAIVLSPGTYSGPGNWDVNLRGKAITIASANPLDADTVEKTIIDCAGSQKEPHRAFYITDCNGLVITGLTITHGLALAGGAVYCQHSTLDLIYCRIVENATLPGDAADPNGGPGGGLYCENSTVRVTGCLISSNTAGGGAPAKGGLAGAGGNGGGICSVNSDLRVVSSTISHNAAGDGGSNGQAPAGLGGDGGGIFANSINMVDSTVFRNWAGAGGQGSPSGRGGRGGGVHADDATMDRCTIEANLAGDGGDGGGVYSSVLLEITNSLIVGNRAGRGYAPDGSGLVDHGNGGGVWCAAGTVRQCTIAGNVVCRSEAGKDKGVLGSAGHGAGVFCTARTTISSSIVYENTPDQLAGQDCNNVTYCNIEPALCASGDNRAFEDPNFVQSGTWVDANDLQTAAKPDDPNAVWTQGDYHLRATSRLFDAGDPCYVAGKNEMDLDGQPRFADAAVDVGAYESQAFVPIYRFWSEKAGKHFYAVGEVEKDKFISRNGGGWASEGAVFYAYTRPSEPNLLPVYRFSSDQFGSFYTIKETEKDKLIKQYAKVWTFEGAAFYAYPEGRQPAGTKAVYRFWSGTLNSHFYTLKESEKDKLIKNYPDVWAFEGVAWYAYESVETTPGEPKAVSHEFSGGAVEVPCAVSLKAFTDGEEAKIDNWDIT